MRKAWGILLLLPLAGALYALWSQPVQLWGRPEKNVTWELAQAPPERLQEVYTRAHPAVLRIDGPEGSRGTGFFYREGLVLTAYHVVAEGGPYTLVLSNQKRATATLLGFAEP
ncbi:serine protease, partial [Thermus scotoductus]